MLLPWRSHLSCIFTFMYIHYFFAFITLFFPSNATKQSIIKESFLYPILTICFKSVIRIPCFHIISCVVSSQFSLSMRLCVWQFLITDKVNRLVHLISMMELYTFSNLAMHVLNLSTFWFGEDEGANIHLLVVFFHNCASLNIAQGFVKKPGCVSFRGFHIFHLDNWVFDQLFEAFFSDVELCFNYEMIVFDF